MIKKAALFYSKKKNISDEIILSVLDILKEKGCQVLMAEMFENPLFTAYGNVTYEKRRDMCVDCDLVIALGGDGTIIHASRLCSPYNIPIIGVNFGTLGYLADLEASEISKLADVIDGNYSVEERMMLEVSIIRNGEEIKCENPCLNETVLSNSPFSRLTKFKLCCDGLEVENYASDGIIISTPTGSSAYSMSAGGPLVYQTMECIVATPVCPHALNSRPIVFKGDSVLEIREPYCRDNDMFITLDGRDNYQVYSEDRIIIKKSKIKTRLLRTKNYGFVGVLNRKMSENHNSY